MPTTIESYKNTEYGAPPQFGKVNNGNGNGNGVGDVPHFLEAPQYGPRADIDPDAPGPKGFPGHEPAVVHPNTKSGAPFKLRSGNTSSFKMMGSSPAKIFGGLFGGGGIRGIMDKIRAKREAKRAKRLGLTATAPGGGGGEGSHTHGTGGEAIGGAQTVTATPAAPEMPAEELDEAVV
jgi:hypothetical protein